jgi:lambda repressor-like predicted transcriptional regulator
MKGRRHNKFSATDIKVALLRRGWTVSRLAAQIGRSRQAVSSTINGSTRFPRVRAAIQEALR